MNSLRYFGQIIGNALPIELRDIDSLKKKEKGNRSQKTIIVGFANNMLMM